MEDLSLPIGNTPMLEIEYLYKGRRDKFFAKLESYNLTGSIKDRAAYYILKKAINSGNLNQGQAIAEESSGNYG